ncbi:hypothetical protein HF888_11520 [Bermanella marisrubri]|uniref:DUF11 domain-containing protein n=1 Tax=Bermanella marisrubri TaxID=207949 RepID=Q1N146_9GAMM|nr:hypothetical protein [Bermanella marisrubri]EAT12005.1 hypothetical protein RED65_11710 [Oceanobacter sp. RED65] [Bermanella marisrubri]QIZ84810.1 hypothetical protein HF888_11520 [Bermanella marisrubri]
MESRVVTIGNKGATQSQQFAWYCLCFVVLAIFTKQALAETPISLKQSFAGNLSFTVTGASFRPRSNNTGNGACFTNSSASASIGDVPSGANVIAAYLFWAGSGAPDYQVTLNGQTVSADFSSRHTYELDSNRRFFGGSADITSNINNPNRSYTLRNLSIEDDDNYCDTETVLGAWAIAIIYETPAEEFRVVNVYEGFQAFSGSTPPLTLIPSNFKLPEKPTGKHAHITWEGDDNLNAGGENLEFEGALLFDSNNPSGNQFNSYSNVQGGSNTYGLDVDAYDIGAYLTPGDEQVITRYSSGQDLVILSSEIISVSNIPVADLQLEALFTDNTVWDKNIPQTLSFRLTNNGPSNINALDTRFELQLPPNTSYAGPAPSGFNCAATSNLVTCEKTTTFAANSSIDLSINLDASNVDTSGGVVNASFSASIDHDLANSPELFDNRQSNNSGSLSKTIGALDYNNSAILLTDDNAGLFLASDSISTEITLSNGRLLDTSDASIIIDIPSDIESFSVDNTPTGSNVTTIPDGGANGTGQIIISNINFSANENPNITLTLNTDPAIEPDNVYSLTAIVNDNNQSWTITSNELIVSDGTLPASGNKQLYLNNNSTMSRERPSNLNGTVDIARGLSQTWELTPALQDDLTFSLDDALLEVNLKGNGIRTGNFSGTQTSYQAEYNLLLTLSDSNGNVLAQRALTVSPNNTNFTLQSSLLENSLGSQSAQLSSGQNLLLTITNNSNTFRNFFYSYDPGAISIKVREAISSTALADGYSALILNAQTVINVDSIEVWSEPFQDNDNDGIDDSGAQLTTSSQPDTQLSVRATVSDPFGAFDISSVFITVNNASISNQAMVEIDDKIADNTTATKTFETIITLAEEDETLGNWNISVIANEGIEGDVSHARSSNFMVLPFQPNVNLSKTIEVINDPINGPLSAGNKPKAIPGAEIQYTISAINTGRGKSDANSIVLQDEIPQNADLFIGQLSCSNRGPGSGLGPICFEDGATPNESGLTYDFNSITNLSDDIAFSVDGSDFSYEPSDEGDGYDSNIRFIRISPSGELRNANKNGSTEPSFNFKYQIRLQ